MVLITYTIVDDGAVVIEAFHTFHAGHAVNRALRPDASTEEAEVVKVSIFRQCFI
jgi:hypothetical protein